ncbi:helix-turn-helix domain-containing protein [Maricaulaceae bacterium MS644]
MREYSTSIVKGATCPILDVSFDEAVARSALSDKAKQKAALSVTSHDFVALWDSVIDLAGPRFDPLSLGRKMANGTMAPIFLACTCAPNLRVGLERVARYKALFGPVLMVISSDRDLLRVEFRPDADDIELPASLTIPMSIFVVEKARNHSARHISPASISLPESRYDLAAVEAYFGSPPQSFDVVALEFTEKDANTRFISENEALWLDVERELEQQLQDRNASGSFASMVEAAIRAELYGGPTHAEAVCRRLRISRSTLQRRLKDEGSTFQTILDQVRFELAARYLTKSEFSMTEISRMIGFLDSKSFFRAFKKQFGMTPEAYRSRQAKT